MSFEVEDYRSCSRKSLTNQQISSRMHIIKDAIRQNKEELAELEDMLSALSAEQHKRIRKASEVVLRFERSLEEREIDYSEGNRG